MTAKELIGKRVEWLEAFDIARGQGLIRRGTVTGAKGKNIEIDGDWRWIDDLRRLRVVPEYES